VIVILYIVRSIWLLTLLAPGKLAADTHSCCCLSVTYAATHSGHVSGVLSLLCMMFTIAFCCSPEGLATFVGYISAPSTGVLIAVAIALHK
jgi:hypothetical protein